MTLTRLILLLSISCVTVFLCACDGLTIRKSTIDLTQSRPLSSVSTVETDDFQNFFRLIEEVAKKNGLKCNPYEANKKYFGCGIGYFNLMSYVKGEKIIQLELSEFGPWGKTKRYEKLEKDVNEMLIREFPGRNYVLSQE
jgi:hypothetical protein